MVPNLICLINRVGEIDLLQQRVTHLFVTNSRDLYEVGAHFLSFFFFEIVMKLIKLKKAEDETFSTVLA